MTASRRELLLSAAFALWGLAIAIALISVWDRPAPAGQLPGVATALGFDAHGPFRWIGGLMLLPILLPALLRPLTRRLSVGRAWPMGAVIGSILVTLWLVTISRDVLWAILVVAIVLVLATLLRDRDLDWSRGDAVLFPVFLTAWLGLFDAVPSLRDDRVIWIAALLVFVVRVAVGLMRSPVSAHLAFVLAPLGLTLLTGFFARDQRYFGWHALALVVITPFLLRAFVRISGTRLRKLLVFVIYPLALYAYPNATSVLTFEGKPRVNVFEDGHSLLPASEYLRGERPYRDMLPAHGLIEDGLLDTLLFQVTDRTVGSSLKARATIGNLNAVLLYAVAIAVTGSAEAALFAVFLSVLTGTFHTQVRQLPALLTLAFLFSAVRWRRPRWLANAAFCAVLTGLTSLDFGFYVTITMLVACIRLRRWREPLAGVAAGVIPLGVVLLVFGILDDFLRGTFVETLSAGSAYVLNFFSPPELMRKFSSFPDILAVALDRQVFLYLFWCMVAVFVGAAFARPFSRRREPLFLTGVFMVLTAISYGERHHLYFSILVSTVIVFVILRLLRTGQHAMAGVAIAAAIALAGPTTHMGVVGQVRQARGPEAGWVTLQEPPRARGALFLEGDAQSVTSVGRYVALALGPEETFFDFTNRGLYYFLFRRDCPIREYEVAFYQTEAGQREVIRRIEENPKIRAALVPSHPQSRYAVDGIPNATRAPLVWAYLEENFTPDFEEGDVVFWRRK